MCRVCDAYREVQSESESGQVQLELPLIGGAMKGQTSEREYDKDGFGLLRNDYRPVGELAGMHA